MLAARSVSLRRTAHASLVPRLPRGNFWRLKRIFLCLPLALASGLLLSLTTMAAPDPGAGMSATIDRSQWPAAVQNVPLDRLSSGALSLLDHGGDLVRPATPLVGPLQAEAAVTLDLRVAPNLRLGDDPSPPLPPAMRSQAEPHIARSPVDPELLVATFQEGRFADGGAVDCGYSVTSDGGLTWTRALIPNLTTVTGGPYFRATDPVAGIDLNQWIYLCTEGATNVNFTEGAVLVSRSVNGGNTFGVPSVVVNPDTSTDFPDKPWMAINTFAGTATVGRILVTWTQFGTTNASPILRAYSDDQGMTWSAALPIHSATSTAQGSQPMFLPDGRVAIVYWNFGGSGSATATRRRCRKKLTWWFRTMVARALARRRWSRPCRVMTPPSIRTGVVPSLGHHRPHDRRDLCRLSRVRCRLAAADSVYQIDRHRRDLDCATSHHQQSRHRRFQSRDLGFARWANADRFLLRSARQRRQHAPLQSLPRAVVRRRGDLAAGHAPHERDDQREPRTTDSRWLHVGRLSRDRTNDRP